MIEENLELQDIPLVVFSEFAITDDPEQRTFRLEKGVLTVKTCYAQRPGPKIPHTLVHHKYISESGQDDYTKLEVYTNPVNIDAFCIKSKERIAEPKLTIISYSQNLDIEKPSPSTPWKENHGYWVQEYLSVLYGNQFKSSTNIVSDNNDWEFKFLLDIQIYAYNIAHNVVSRGHWESERVPYGDYSKKVH